MNGPPEKEEPIHQPPGRGCEDRPPESVIADHTRAHVNGRAYVDEDVRDFFNAHSDAIDQALSSSAGSEELPAVSRSDVLLSDFFEWLRSEMHGDKTPTPASFVETLAVALVLSGEYTALRYSGAELARAVGHTKASFSKKAHLLARRWREFFPLSGIHSAEVSARCRDARYRTVASRKVTPHERA